MSSWVWTINRKEKGRRWWSERLISDRLTQWALWYCHGLIESTASVWCRKSTYMLCSTHQPQCGSPELRHSWHVPYCSHDSTGTCVTCEDQTAAVRACSPTYTHGYTHTHTCVQSVPIRWDVMNRSYKWHDHTWRSLESATKAQNVNFHWLLAELKASFSLLVKSNSGRSKEVNWI